MPVKRFRFDTIEVDKPKEEKCKVISNNKKNTGENPIDYLELKHSKKIQVLNGACLEDNLDSQMPTLNGLVENDPLYF